MKIAFYLEDETVECGTRDELMEGLPHHRQFRTAASLFRGLKCGTWDVVVAGWYMPDLDGHDLLRWARAMLPVPPPIMFVTRHNAPRDIVAALDGGAIEYVLAPVHGAVLRARIEAILKLAGTRASPAPVHETPELALERHGVRFGQYVLDRRRHYVELRGEQIALRPKEYHLATLLFENVGRPLTRAFLWETIWATDEKSPGRSLDTLVCRLREKLRLVQGNGFEIRSVNRVGYRLDAV